jgi:dTDP-4-amino-4,6-dideoxygalactose transaminase
MINVTKTYLPPFEEYTTLLKRAWDKAWLTNNGVLVQELEAKLKEYLGVKHLLFTTNGTVVLQMALKAFGITKEVITTPFSYVATTNAILWEGCKPVFADIDRQTFCIDADAIERAITEDTQAILATHVYGLPCDVDRIEKIAAKHGLKVIYDGAHAFGSMYNDRSLLSYGDISTCSFHATKLFHTVEGGCIICHDDELARKLLLSRSFGHIADDYYSVGINAKNSEFHAAMGLAVFPHLPEIFRKRKALAELYRQSLNPQDVQMLDTGLPNFRFNYAHFPVMFRDEATLLKVRAALEAEHVFTRRYFYPSLSSLPFIERTPCPVSDDYAARVLALPFYPDLEHEDVRRICRIISEVLNPMLV